MHYREDDFEGLALSGRHVFCPQPDEAPHVVGKVGEPDLHAGSRKADRADCQIEQTLLMRKHMLFVASRRGAGEEERLTADIV